MNLDINILSHGRLSGLKRTLDSIKTATETVTAFEELMLDINLTVNIGINNDPEELVNSKLELVKEYPNLNMVCYVIEGKYMSTLRKELMKYIPRINKDLYFWVDDDDFIHPEMLKLLSLNDRPSCQYHQFGTSYDLEFLKKRYILDYYQTNQMKGYEGRQLMIAKYSDYGKCRMDFYCPSLASGEVYSYNISDACGMYEFDPELNAGEDILPSMTYLNYLHHSNLPVILHNAVMIFGEHSTRKYSLESQISMIATLSEHRARLSSDDAMKENWTREITNLIKYNSYNCVHRRRYTFDEPWLGL